ncbi:DUF2515 family protein [Bacillus sp. AGMB 02131]|uniref:DUF2515 family protein n=2 Tax=Peribacillus faecalis TaxID=2772559 RepID=A0A927CYL5_9BACI|nr:DUF2515 family protein [Peribacillus faecalis]
MKGGLPIFISSKFPFLVCSKLPEHLVPIKKNLKMKSKINNKPLSVIEKKIIREIKERTSILNENNITRTKAYLDFYVQFPEIHWAFLAHMVSRNAGWNMTDLKGSLLSWLLEEKQRQSFFDFLERGNWLIFQDAYPQLLLYEHTKKSGISCFHLLAHFNISRFMEVIWESFLNTSNSNVLTNALIINEQNYIQSRLLEKSSYKKQTIFTLEFQLQDLLSMNQLIFPYREHGKAILLGDTLHFFESLPNRISFGKKLYKILYGESFEHIKSWAMKTTHTGSRKDFWPQLFNDRNETLPFAKFKPVIDKCGLPAGAPRLFSPTLVKTWPTVKHEPAEIQDWYRNWRIVYGLTNDDVKIDAEIKRAYCETLHKLELAILAKQTFLK